MCKIKLNVCVIAVAAMTVTATVSGGEHWGYSG